MKQEIFLNAGSWAASPECREVQDQIDAAIKAACWPEGRSGFTIRPVRKGNGVTPIKLEFINSLTRAGWTPEAPVRIGTSGGNVGNVDALREYPGRLPYAVEWETGNVSSSHRSLNKLALGIIQGKLIGGSVIVPSRLLYPYLTDRIGSYEELAPYFDLWKALAGTTRDGRPLEGYLSIISVQHDTLVDEDTIPLIPKGSDGNSTGEQDLLLAAHLRRVEKEQKRLARWAEEDADRAKRGLKPKQRGRKPVLDPTAQAEADAAAAEQEEAAEARA